MAIARAEPIQKGVKLWPFSNPINSVRRAVIAGFVVLVLILIAVVAGSAYMVRTYQSDTAAMQKRANVASLLQEAEANASMSALLSLRYSLAGGENYPVEIVALSDATGVNLQDARALAVELDDQERVAELDALYAKHLYLNNDETGARKIVALREEGKVEEALAVQEADVPIFRELRLGLMEANASELQKVSDLESRANNAGDLAFLLLIVSGVAGGFLGIIVAILIARSILRPLHSLESTARTVAKGSLDARASAGGLRELSHLGETMNYMMDTIQDRTEQIQEHARQLVDARAQAATDPLTGLGNHRRFHEKIRDVVDTAQTDGTPVGMIMMDVDNFKGVNDTLGHQAGDQVLRDVSATITETVSQEQAYRYGGDEFAILLLEHDRQKTAEIAENLLSAIEKRTTGGDAERITVSIGVATFPDMAESVQELIYRSDMALNWAKSAGKNQVGVWDKVFGSRQNGDEPDVAAET